MWWGMFRTSLLANLQYRVAGMIWMGGMILEPIIYLVVWRAVVDAGGGEVAGYDAPGVSAYFLTFFFVQNITFTWVMETFQYRVQQGQLAFELLRPVHPVVADIMDNFTFKLVMLFMVVPAMLGIYLGFDPEFTFQAWSVMLFFPSLVMAWCVRFTIEWTLSLAAFWTVRVTAINRAYYGVMLFLSGRAAPLAFLPEGLRDVAFVLPFYSMVGMPVELVLGRLSPELAVRALSVQAMWVVAGILMVRLAWGRAVRQFSAVGS